jgi:ribosome biogenesis GTPase
LLNPNEFLATTPQTGTVFKRSQGSYTVHSGSRPIVCTLSSKLRRELIYPIADPSSIRPHVVGVADIKTVDPVAIGDTVRFVPAGDGSGMIVEVLPRRNKLVRRAAGVKPLEQVIVANADQFVPVMSAARPAPSWELMDRYLAAAEEANLPSCIVVTKMDLVDTGATGEKGRSYRRSDYEQVLQEAQTYERIGYRVILTSASTGTGIEELRAELREKISVLAGKSGVGKTTLLNTIQSGLGLRVNDVGKHTGKGKHTTTHLEMFPLDIGGAIVDTPGMREFGLWNVDGNDLAHLFPDLHPFIGRCRFGLSCSHVHEPGCAVRDAVEAGEVTQRRYQSYLRMAAG